MGGRGFESRQKRPKLKDENFSILRKRVGSCAFSNCCRRYCRIVQVCLTTRLGSAFRRGVDDRHSATWSLTKNRSNKKEWKAEEESKNSEDQSKAYSQEHKK